MFLECARTCAGTGTCTCEYGCTHYSLREIAEGRKTKRFFVETELVVLSGMVQHFVATQGFLAQIAAESDNACAGKLIKRWERKAGSAVETGLLVVAEMTLDCITEHRH